VKTEEIFESLFDTELLVCRPCAVSRHSLGMQICSDSYIILNSIIKLSQLTYFTCLRLHNFLFAFIVCVCFV